MGPENNKRTVTARDPSSGKQGVVDGAITGGKRKNWHILLKGQDPGLVGPYARDNFLKKGLRISSTTETEFSETKGTDGAKGEASRQKKKGAGERMKDRQVKGGKSHVENPNLNILHTISRKRGKENNTLDSPTEPYFQRGEAGKSDHCLRRKKILEYEGGGGRPLASQKGNTGEERALSNTRSKRKS